MHRTLALTLFLVFAACSAIEGPSSAPVSRALSQDWAAGVVKVSVPARLSVNTENSYLPKADIVWHEDPAGDPRAHVGDIVETGAIRAMKRLTGARPVVIAVEVQRFHALTQRARYTAPFGRHNVLLHVQVFDQLTGRSLSEPAEINASFLAYTGAQAVQAEENGLTQRIRLQRRIEAELAYWMGVGPSPDKG